MNPKFEKLKTLLKENPKLEEILKNFKTRFGGAS